MKGVKEIRIPDRVTEGNEVVRVIEQEQHFVLLIDATLGAKEDEDPTIAWALLLTDLAQFAASSLCGKLVLPEGEEVPKEEILRRMKQYFDAEWSDRTDEVKRLVDA